MDTPAETQPADERVFAALIADGLAEAKRRIAEVKALFHRPGKDEHAVVYTQARHREIDRLLQTFLAEAYVLVRVSGDKRRELEDRVRVLEARLASLETRTQEGERDDEPSRKPPRLSAV